MIYISLIQDVKCDYKETHATIFKGIYVLEKLKNSNKVDVLCTGKDMLLLGTLGNQIFRHHSKDIVIHPVCSRRKLSKFNSFAYSAFKPIYL